MRIIYLFFIPLLILTSCTKPIIEFKLNTDVQQIILKLYKNNTFVKEVDEIEDSYKYSGYWQGNFKDGDTICFMTTMKDYSVLTNTPKEYFKIINGKLEPIIKNGFEKGWRLSDFLNFNDIKRVKIRNVDGPHYLTKKQLNEFKPDLINARSIGGLICKPQWLTLFFELKGGNIIEGSICGNLINFEDKISGSFRIEREIDFNSY